MFRVLKPGGRCFFTMVNRYALDAFYVHYGLKNLMHRVLGLADPPHCEFVTPRQVRRDLNAVGFSDVETDGRMLAPLRLGYKFSSALGARLARAAESWDDSLSRHGYMTPFAGHLVVIAARSTGAANSRAITDRESVARAPVNPSQGPPPAAG
jgi:hypothetical protein